MRWMVLMHTWLSPATYDEVSRCTLYSSTNFPVVVARHVGHELLVRLLAQVPGVDQKQDALGVGVLEEAVDRGDGGVGLAGAGRHLHEGPRVVPLERGFEAFDGDNLAPSQPRRIQVRKALKPCAQRPRLREPLLHRVRPMKAEHLP